jgi:riboflavin synthase
MFTGLVQAQGRIISKIQQGDLQLLIAPNIADFPLQLGASIACNGICLTVTEFTAVQFQVALSAETLRVTTAADWIPGQLLNLEPSLRVGDALGGHFVSGHVDGVGQVLQTQPIGDSVRVRFSIPVELMQFIAVKGSLAIDGVSLTINAIGPNWCEVNIIAHTRLHTNFATLMVGDKVNIEIDLLARYAVRKQELNNA